jgi:hypothetical protein
MSRVEVSPTPQTVPLGSHTDEAPPRVPTTLYEVIAALQDVVEPDEDHLIGAIVVDWLRSGRLRWPANVTIAA